MRQSGLVLGALGRAVAATVIGASLLAALPAHAAKERDPGFYFGFSAFGARLDDQPAAFGSTVPGIPGTDPTTCTIPLPIGPLNLGPLGCLVGPGTPGDPGRPGSVESDRGTGS